MISDNRIGILDWQGGRLGPMGYDLASLLIDPYVDLNLEEKSSVYNYYLSLLDAYETNLVEPFIKYYPYLSIQRNLQILGAYSYLSKVQGKTFFEQYITPAIRSLSHILDELNDPKLSSLNDLTHDLFFYDRT